MKRRCVALEIITLELDKKLFKVINAQLENLGLSIHSSKGAVIDATIVESAARPRRVIELNKVSHRVVRQN